MNRLIVAAIAATALVGCYDAEYVEPTGAVPAGGVQVSSAPPPLQQEVALDCGGNVWLPGSWNWGASGWAWQAGQCVPAQAGYVYVQPYYIGGIYYPGYWGLPGAYRGYYGARFWYGGVRGGYVGGYYRGGYGGYYGARGYGYGGYGYRGGYAGGYRAGVAYRGAPAGGYRAPAAAARTYRAPAASFRGGGGGHHR